MIKGILIFFWTLLIGYFYFGEWDPLVLEHPLSLFNRELLHLAGDIPAAFLKLFTQGIAELLFITVLALASLGAGSFLLKRMPVKVRELQGFCLPVSLGLMVLGYATFVLGLLGGFNRSGLIVLWTVLIILAVMGCQEIAGTLKNSKWNFSWQAGIAFCLTGIVWIFLLAKALWPAVHYDAITYHLGVPKYYLLEGAISYIPYDSCSNFPFLAEMLYTLCFFAAGQKAAQLSLIFMFIITGFGLYEFAKNFIRELPPWLPMLFFTVIPCGMTLAVYYGNDIHLAFYVLMSLYGFLLWEKYRNNSFLVLLGLFVGACLSMKYAALVYMPLLLAVGTGCVLWKQRAFFVRQWLWCLVISGISALIVFMPWLVKNYLYTGNPLYPGFFALFGGADMNREMYDKIQGMVVISDVKLMVTGVWNNLYRLLFFRPDLLDNSLQRNLGPLLLFLLPLIVFIKKIPKAVKTVLCAAGVIYITWCCTFVSVRFLFPAVVLLTIVAAYAVAEAARQVAAPFSIWIKAAAAGIVLFSCITGFYQVNLVTQTYGFDFIEESDDDFLRRHMIDDTAAILFSYPAYAYANANVPSNALVLVVGDAQHLYLDLRHRYTYLSATSPYDVFKAVQETPLDIARSLKADGITHIMYNPLEMSRLEQVGASLFTKKDQDIIEKFLSSTYVRRLYSRRFFVYQTRKKAVAKLVCLYELL